MTAYKKWLLAFFALFLAALLFLGGITAVIDPSGRITSSIETYQTGYLNAKAEYLYERTLYSLIGDLPFYICLALCIIAWIWDIIKQSMGKKCKISFTNPAK